MNFRKKKREIHTLIDTIRVYIVKETFLFNEFKCVNINLKDRYPLRVQPNRSSKRFLKGMRKEIVGKEGILE